MVVRPAAVVPMAESYYSNLFSDWGEVSGGVEK